MRVSRLGNSLMVRVPASVVAALHLREGDQVEILGAGEKQLYMAREPDLQGRPTAKRRTRSEATASVSPQLAAGRSRKFKTSG